MFVVVRAMPCPLAWWFVGYGSMIASKTITLALSVPLKMFFSMLQAKEMFLPTDPNSSCPNSELTQRKAIALKEAFDIGSRQKMLM